MYDYCRAITVFDDTDVKLLHILAFGKSWYGKWGYHFHGGFNSQEGYEYAVRVLNTLSIETIETPSTIEDRLKIKHIIDKNRQLSKFSLTSVSDFLQVILAFEVKVNIKDIDSISASLGKRGKKKGDIKYALLSIASVMKQKKAAKVDKLTKQELLQEMAKYQIDRSLADWVLDNISIFRIKNHFIQCSRNSSTKVCEFMIPGISQEINLEAFPISQGDKLAGRIDLGESLDKDVQDFDSALRSVYRDVIDSMSLATGVVLISRSFVKRWPLQEPDSSQSATELCKLGLHLKSMSEHFDRAEIEKMEQREVDIMLDLATSLRCEDPKFNVNCTCGTIYDVGQRTAMCSVCKVIHHTRCSGIEDNADVPANFLCAHCRNQ